MNTCDLGYCAVFVQSKLESQRTPRRVVFIGGLPDGATEGDVIQLGLPFGRMTNLVFAKKKCQVWWALMCPFIIHAITAVLFCAMLLPLVSDRYAKFWWHFVTASYAQKVLVSGCSHSDTVNQTPQIRHIGYRSAVALSCLIVTDYSQYPMSSLNIGLTLAAIFVLADANGT